MSIKYTKIQLKRNKEDATNLDTYHPSVGEPVFSTYSTGNKLIIGDRNQDSVNEMVSDNKYFPEMIEILGLYAGSIKLSKSGNNNTSAYFGIINCNNFSSDTQINLEVLDAGGLTVSGQSQSTTITSDKFVVTSSSATFNHKMYVGEKATFNNDMDVNGNATFKKAYVNFNGAEQYRIYCDNDGNLRIDSKNVGGTGWIPSILINKGTGTVCAQLKKEHGQPGLALLTVTDDRNVVVEKFVG